MSVGIAHYYSRLVTRMSFIRGPWQTSPKAAPPPTPILLRCIHCFSRFLVSAHYVLVLKSSRVRTGKPAFSSQARGGITGCWMTWTEHFPITTQHRGGADRKPPMKPQPRRAAFHGAGHAEPEPLPRGGTCQEGAAGAPAWVNGPFPRGGAVLIECLRSISEVEGPQGSRWCSLWPRLLAPGSRNVSSLLWASGSWIAMSSSKECSEDLVRERVCRVCSPPGTYTCFSCASGPPPRPPDACTVAVLIPLRLLEAPSIPPQRHVWSARQLPLGWNPGRVDRSGWVRIGCCDQQPRCVMRVYFSRGRPVRQRLLGS